MVTTEALFENLAVNAWSEFSIGSVIITPTEMYGVTHMTAHYEKKANIQPAAYTLILKKLAKEEFGRKTMQRPKGEAQA